MLQQLRTCQKVRKFTAIFCGRVLWTASKSAAVGDILHGHAMDTSWTRHRTATDTPRKRRENATNTLWTPHGHAMDTLQTCHGRAIDTPQTRHGRAMDTPSCLSLSGPCLGHWACLGLVRPGLSGPVWAFLGLSGPCLNLVWACLGLV